MRRLSPKLTSFFSHGKDHETNTGVGRRRRSSLASFSPNCGRSQASVSPLPSQHRILIGRYVNKNSQAASITNKVSNSSAKRRTHYQISPPYSVPPPFPRHLGISVPIDSHSEGLLMAGNQNRRSPRILEKRAKQNRRMSFMIIVRHLAMIAADSCDVM